MLIVALVLAVIGLAALVTAVVTSNELIAWVCIAASVIGVLLLIVDALRERSRTSSTEPSESPEPAAHADMQADEEADDEAHDEPGHAEDYPEEAPIAHENDESDESDVETDSNSR